MKLNNSQNNTTNNTNNNNNNNSPPNITNNINTTTLITTTINNNNNNKGPILKSYLHLTDPIFLQGEWKYSWFDVARQQMLLFKDSTFYIWSPCSLDPGPTFYYTDTHWPAPMLLAKISIDSQLLAIQYSKNSIYVVDILGGRKWNIYIKSANGSEILPNGVIWSEHGGNSQDLIFVTSRGIELYKVSTARGQCKLSRNITIKNHFFWYEPNFRFILVAVTARDMTLEATGFFLRYDMSDMPRLELPPPDRTSTFTLGGGAGPQDVKLLTLYGKLYCAVRYPEVNGDTLTLYHLTKTKVEKMYNFPLHMSSDVMLSVTDNILCCHCLHYNVSLLFDIKNSSSLQSTTNISENSNSQVDFLCGACTMTVDSNQIQIPIDPLQNLISSSPQSSSPLKDNSHLETRSSSSSSSISNNNNNNDNNNNNNHNNNNNNIGSVSGSLPRTHSLPTSQQGEEWLDVVGVGGELGLDSINLVTLPTTNNELTSGLNVHTGGYSRSRHNSVSSTTGQLPISIPSPSPSPCKTFFPSDTTNEINNQTLDKNERSNSSDNNISNNKQINDRSFLSPVRSFSETIRHATEPYSGDWQLIFPYWIWNPSTRCLIKIKCNLSAIASSFHDPKKVVNFLSLRGNPVVAPRPTFFADYDDSFEAKKILLTRLFTSLEDQSLSVQWVSIMLEEMINNYAIEHYRRNNLNQNRRDRSDGLKNTYDDDIINNNNNNNNNSINNMNNINTMIQNDSFSFSNNNSTFNSNSSNNSNFLNQNIGMTKDDLGPTSLSQPSRPRRRIFASSKNDDNELNQENISLYQQQQNSLYLHTSPTGIPTRKMSVNTQTLTSIHLERLKEQEIIRYELGNESFSNSSFFQNSSTTGLSFSSSSSSPSPIPLSTSSSLLPSIFNTQLPPLEPNLDVRLFFPEIFTIGINSFQRKNDPTSTPPPLSAPPPLSILRNEESSLICTQTEIFSFVLLPFALKLINDESYKNNYNLQQINIDKLLYYLHSFISYLKLLSIPINISLSLLVIHLLCYQKKFLEITHVIHLQFLNDSPEIGLALLDMSDLIEDEYLERDVLPCKGGVHSVNNSINTTTHEVLNHNEVKTEIKYHKSSLNQNSLINLRELKYSLYSLRQVGIDLLWRNIDKVTVIRWLLSHNKVLDAIFYCTKIRGQWRNGINSVQITGLDFFRSTISELCYIKERNKLNSYNLIPIKYLNKNYNQILLHKKSVYDLNMIQKNYKYDHKNSNIEEEEKELKVISSTEQQGIYLLYSVYKFLMIWDPTLLNIQKLTGKSRLASMAHFPDDLFNEINTLELKKLYGFI